jgi:hypothetical protein
MKEIKSEKELEEVLKSPDKVVIFYFWDMCPHCQNMHEPYDDLEDNHKDTKFVKVETKNIPEKLGKDSFPEFELRKNKKVIGKARGEMSKDDLEKELFGGSLRGGRRRTRTRRLRRRVGKVGK